MPPRRLLPVLLLPFALACATAGALAPPDGETATAAYFASLRQRPALMRAFLRQMPKGGDLHNHLSGAIYAESYLRWAEEDGLCIDRSSLSLVAPPCDASQRPPAATALKDGALYGRMVDALSMRDFVPGPQSGHDHFFATFSRFHATVGSRAGDMLAEAVERAGEEHVSYLEIMTSPGMNAARRLGIAVGGGEDLRLFRDKLMAAGMADLVAGARKALDDGEARMRADLHCGTPKAKPGCAVTVRYLAQAIRVVPPAQVYAQLVFAFALEQADPRVVGLNLVAPEDDRVALRDYDLQMRMLGFLHHLMPKVPISLHAGELAEGLVPPQDLRFHIREAVEVAGAERIGHGVDILDEDHPWALMREMARKHIDVEISLTSNDEILGVRGPDHPLPSYLRYGVPVTLSTDDEGVSRIDLTHELERAARTYGLSYPALKSLVRNSLEYSFLPGASLWRTRRPYAIDPRCAATVPGGVHPPPACRDLLAHSEKAAAQWRLEGELARFEATDWTAR